MCRPPRASIAMASLCAGFSLAASAAGKKLASEDAWPPRQHASATPRARFSLAALAGGKKRASDDVEPPNQQAKVPNASELSIDAGLVHTAWRTSDASGRPCETEADATPGKPSSASRVADVPALRPHANDGTPSDARNKKQFQTPLGRATCLTGDAPGRPLETKAVAPPDKPPSDLVGPYVSLVSQTRQPRATGAPCVDVEAGVKLRKRAKFNPPAKREPAKVPMASQINIGAPVATIPPTEVMDLIGDNDLVVGVDIETHDWETNAGSKGYVGQYGFYTRCDSDDHAARIVQLGWAISANGAETRVK